MGLTESVGWNFTPEQMASFMAVGHFMGHRHGGRLISSAALFPFGPKLSAIGLVIVHPDFRRQGLARDLVHSCLAHAKCGRACVLVATEMGYPVYVAMGFRTAGQIERMSVSRNTLEMAAMGVHRSEGASVHKPYETIALDAQNMLDVARFDAQLVLGPRDSVYAGLWERGAVGRVAYHLSGETAGFIVASVRGDMLIVNGLFAVHLTLAARLLSELFRDLGDKIPSIIRIDVPDVHTDFVSALKVMGFETNRLSPFMVHGNGEGIEYKRGIYGILDPAFG